MQEAQKLQKQIDQIEEYAKQFMSADAIARYGNLKAVHGEKALQSLMVIAELAGEGKLPAKITDGQYKQLLVQMNPEKKEFRITRK
ncbi:MAG: DNA-binding protein [Nanoarchaeota archaeon]|nr:DNA-binding protein [Nanoarchaeota archaeon]